jgi:hypothetical protein
MSSPAQRQRHGRKPGCADSVTIEVFVPIPYEARAELAPAYLSFVSSLVRRPTNRENLSALIM